MLTVIQQVTEAKVEISNQIVGKVDQGLLTLCGFEHKDTPEHLNRMLTECLNYRIFDDGLGKLGPNEEDYRSFYNPLNRIQQARNRCLEGSDLYNALDDLNNKAINLPCKVIEALGTEANNLLNHIQDTSNQHMIASINLFHENCNELIQGKYHMVINAIRSLTITATVTVIAAIIGFGLGFSLGAWSGPGAFFTGLIAGSASAVAVTGGASLLGLGTLAYTAHTFFKELPVQKAVNEIAELAPSVVNEIAYL